ncbi:MAG: aminoacyl-tRNA hydrolase [Actinomycetota bacterium]
MNLSTVKEGDPQARESTTVNPWLIVGLGNPGGRYAGNRHNVGAMAVELLAEQLSVSLRRHSAGAVVADTRLAALTAGRPGIRVVLARSESYMNTSGGPVAALVRYYRMTPSQVVVIHDELDLPYGTLRLKRGGGPGGHNGLRSITQSLNSPDYFRVRVGIGRPPGRQDPAEFVLRDFSTVERRELPLLLTEAVDATKALITDGLVAAQNRWHAG